MSTLCAALHNLLNRLPRHRFPFDVAAIPRNGIYVLFEDSERAHGGDRIVRVGTHTGANQLRSRLQQHFIRENKDRSIFRKNIGRALLNRTGDPFLTQWDIDLTTRRARETLGHAIDRRKLADVEALVSAYIQGHLSFVVFRVDEKTERLALESRLIATVSRCDACRPSPTWLGLYSPKEKIRASGLWLVNELWKEPMTPEDLARIAALCAATRGA
jgi:hypothetical protein